MKTQFVIRWNIILAAASMVGWLASCGIADAATSYAWTGKINSSWGDGRNWNPNGVPVDGDSVMISSGTVNAAGLAVTLVQLSVSGGTINNLGTVGVQSLALTGGVINATSLALNGASTWSGGQISGHIAVATGATLAIPAGVAILGGNSVLANAGTVAMTGGQLQGWDKGVIDNHGTWTLTGHANPFTAFYGGNVFNNHGVLKKTGGADPSNLSGSWTFNLPGETRAQTGELRFVAATVLPAGAKLTGEGTIRSVGATTVNGEVVESVASLILNGGRMTANAGAAISGELEWLTGEIEGTLAIASGSTLRVSGDGSRRLLTDAVIDNRGTILFEAASPIEGWERASIRNRSEGVFQCTVDGDLFSKFYSGNRLINEGTFLKSGGSGGALWNDWTVVHSGSLRVASGSVICQGETHLLEGAVIEGSGEVQWAGDMRLEGAISESISSLRMTGGKLVCSDPSSFAGRLDWEAGTISGRLTVPSGSSFEVSGAGAKTMTTSTIIDVAGIYRWSGTGPVVGYENCRLNILAGGICDFAADGDPFDNFHGGNELINEGTVKKSAGTGGSTLLNNWTHRQRGGVICQVSTLEYGTDLAFEENSTVSGAGAVVIRGNTGLPGAVHITAPTSWTGGTWTGAGGVLTGQLVWSGGYSAGTWMIGDGGNVEIVEGTAAQKQLNAAAEIHVEGSLTLTSGTLVGWDATSRIRIKDGGKLRAAGAFTMDDYFAGPRLEIQPGGRLASANGADLKMDWALDNHGTVSIPAGRVGCNYGGQSTGLFESPASGELRFTGGTQALSAGAEIRGPGNVKVTGGTLEALDPVEGFVHISGGTVQGTAPTGEFRFKDGSQWTSGFVGGSSLIPSGATLTVSNEVSSLRRANKLAAITIDGRLLWQGPGTIECYESTAWTVSAGGVLQLAGDGPIFSQYFSGHTLANHGTIRRSGSAGNATLSIVSTISDGAFQIESGTLSVASPLDLLDGSTISGGGKLALVDAKTSLVGTTTVSGSVLDLAGATLFSAAGDNGQVSGSSIEWSGGYIGGVVTFNGIASTKSGGSRRINQDAELRNAGILTLAGSGVVESRGNSTLRNLSGATLNSTGQVALTQYFGGNQLINEGIMALGSSPGRTVVNYPFVQTSSGCLVVGIAGSDPAAPAFDILQIRDSATLAGTLAVSLEGGYDPPVGASFEILTSTSRSGTFDTVIANRFDATYPLTTSNPPKSKNNVVLVAKAGSALEFATWAGEHGLFGNAALPLVDADGDSTPNWVEYALNMNPRANDVPPFSYSIEEIEGEPWLILRYRRWDDRVAAGVQYLGKWSSDLMAWSDLGLIDEVDPAASLSSGSEARRCRVPAVLPAKFMRLEFPIH